MRGQTTAVVLTDLEYQSHLDYDQREGEARLRVISVSTPESMAWHPYNTTGPDSLAFLEPALWPSGDPALPAVLSLEESRKAP